LKKQAAQVRYGRTSTTTTTNDNDNDDDNDNGNDNDNGRKGLNTFARSAAMKSFGAPPADVDNMGEYVK
jgi:hypothetical protein